MTRFDTVIRLRYSVGQAVPDGNRLERLKRQIVRHSLTYETTGSNR